MTISFWLNVLIVIGAFYAAWLDHGDTYRCFKSAKGEIRRRTFHKLILLWGIPSVSLLVLPFTAIEAWDSNRQINDAKPQNQKIQSVTATAYFYINSTNLPFTWRREGARNVVNANLEAVKLYGFARSPVPTNTAAAEFVLSATKATLEMFETPSSLIRLEFERVDSPENGFGDTTASQLDEWDILLLKVPFLPPNTQLIGNINGGEITIRANSTLSRSYKIPLQKSHFAAKTLSLIATNNQFLNYDFWPSP